LNYSKYVEVGQKNISSSDDYNSHNTEQLDVKGVKALLMKLDIIHHMLPSV
jgi:UDP-N-acetylglucosamine 4,6-dehydratase